MPPHYLWLKLLLKEKPKWRKSPEDHNQTHTAMKTLNSSFVNVASKLGLLEFFYFSME
jgi:hypothetical protein